MSCIAAPTDSNAPLYPARVLSNFSVGALSGSSELEVPVSFGFAAIIGKQSSTHSLQIKTPGPEISFLTSVCDFPQNEQRKTALLQIRAIRVIRGSPYAPPNWFSHYSRSRLRFRA